MNRELLQLINEITKYGLTTDVPKDELEKKVDLEVNLISLYNLYLNDKNYNFDSKEYPEYIQKDVNKIRENVMSNFKSFGYYNLIFDWLDLENQKVVIGDAVDDLQDIISDLLEIKWRIENTSLDDALWNFRETFRLHTKQHVLDLLNFMHQES